MVVVIIVIFTINSSIETMIYCLIIDFQKPPNNLMKMLLEISTVYTCVTQAMM